MDFLSLLSLVLLIIAIFCFVYFTLNLDCDYTLTFLEKFGRSPGEFFVRFSSCSKLFIRTPKLQLIERMNLFFSTLNLRTSPRFNAATLSGKIVWITGSSAGIGRAIAFELAKAGCKLVLSGTKVDRLESAKKECLGELFVSLLGSSMNSTN